MISPLLLVGIGFAVLMVLGAGVALIAGGRGNVEERLDQFVAGAAGVEMEDLSLPAESRPDVADRLDRAIEGRGFSDKIRARIVKADLRLRVSEYLLIQLITTLLGGALFYFIFRRSFVLAPVGAVLGYLVPGIITNIAASRRLRLFDDQLADTLNLMVNSLRSGYSVLQAMESVATEMPSPMNKEFERVVQEVRLGLGLPQALSNMLRRVPSEDLDLVVTAVNIQREVGGNLAEILDIISHTIRERVRIKREIRTLTAQVRMSAYVVTALPFALGGILFAINPEYVGQLIARDDPYIWPNVLPCGWLIIGIGLIMTGIGTVIIRKIVSIQV